MLEDYCLDRAAGGGIAVWSGRTRVISGCRRTIGCALAGLSFFMVAALPLTPGAAAEPTVAQLDPQSGSESPTAIVEGFEGALLQVMRRADRLGYDGRYAVLDPEIRKIFDLTTMARIVSGTTWSGWSAAQRAQLGEAFARFVVSTYARRFDGFGGERFVTDATIPLGNGVLIMTRIVPKDAPPIAINYLARPHPGGGWRVVDVFLSGSISELATQRSQFSAILDRAGYQGLLDALRAKTGPKPAP